MAADQRLTDVVEFGEAFLAADTAVLRAALGEPDDDAYLAVVERAEQLYGPPGEGLPLGPQAGRFASPGGTSPQASSDPGERAGAALFAVGRVVDGGGWIVVVSGAYDVDGGGLGAALLVEEVDGELKVTGRADADPFVDGVAWVEAGGRAVPVDAPLDQSTVVRLPQAPEHAAWLEERFGR